jgi:hypothetical protein
MSKFDQLCNLVIERAEASINEAQGPVYYGLNPEFDSSKLTGFDQLVANFLETNPATADEIVDVIARNSEDPENRSAAQEVFRNLVDSNIVVTSAPPQPEGEEAPEGEPDAAALEQEPEVDVNEPVTPPPAAEEEEEGEEEQSAPVPPPEEDEADTFEPAAAPVKSRVADVAPEADEVPGDEDELDDTPTSQLVANERQKALRKRQQMEGLIRYLHQKRGKTPEEAQAYIDRLAAEGKL